MSIYDDFNLSVMSVEHLIVFLQTDFWRAHKLCFTRVVQISFHPGAWQPGRQQQPQVLLPGEHGQEATQLKSREPWLSQFGDPSSQLGGGDLQVEDGENSHP